MSTYYDPKHPDRRDRPSTSSCCCGFRLPLPPADGQKRLGLKAPAAPGTGGSQANHKNIHPQPAPLIFPPPTSHFPTEPTQLAPSTTPLPPLLHGQPDVFSAVEASGFISKGRSPLCPPYKYLLLFCLLSAAGICTGDPLLRDLRWKETTTSTIHRQQGPKENGQ